MNKSRWIIIVCIGILAALVLVFFLNRDMFFPPEKTISKENSGLVSGEAKRPGEGVKKIIEPAVPKEDTPPSSGPAKPDRDLLQERVNQFFEYLDRQEYIQAYNLKGGSYRHFLGVFSKLSGHHPAVVGEMDDLILLRRNMAHFFRVMGKNDIKLVVDILSHEEREIERAMEVLYEWGVREAKQKGGAIEADMEDLYEYAGFFLNTVAGKAYLLRRDSRVRILLTYYSILILDEANRLRMNRHGIDILPQVNLLIDDMNRYQGLVQTEKYLGRLNTIREKTGR
jgi:hypothetical protein